MWCVYYYNANIYYFIIILLLLCYYYYIITIAVQDSWRGASDPDHHTIPGWGHVKTQSARQTAYGFRHRRKRKATWQRAPAAHRTTREQVND